MKMDVKVAAQLDVLNNVRRYPTIAWGKWKNRGIDFLDMLLINFPFRLPVCNTHTI